MASRREKIIRELLSIYVRYDLQEIEEALRSIETGEFSSQLARLSRSMLTQAQTVGPETSIPARRSKPRGGSRAHLQKRIEELLASSDPSVQDLGRALSVARDSRRSTAELRAIASSIGIPDQSFKDRSALIGAIADAMAHLPNETVAPLLSQLAEAEDRTSALERWTNIIVQKDRQ